MYSPSYVVGCTFYFFAKCPFRNTLVYKDQLTGKDEYITEPGMRAGHIPQPHCEQPQPSVLGNLTRYSPARRREGQRRGQTSPFSMMGDWRLSSGPAQPRLWLRRAPWWPAMQSLNRRSRLRLQPGMQAHGLRSQSSQAGVEENRVSKSV